MADVSRQPGRIARFGPFELDSKTGELRKGGRKVRLQDQPFQLLLLFLQHPRDLITRDALRQRLWPADTFVDFDQGLNNAIRRLRDALRDSADAPRYVETLPRLGYRFIATVEWLPQAPLIDPPPVALPAVAPSNIEPDVPLGVAAAGSSRAPLTRWSTRVRVPAAVILLLSAAVGYLLWDRSAAAPSTRSDRIMVAVLPFETLGEDPDQDYIGDGLTEEMIGQLGAIAPDSLGVIAPTSAMQYKGARKAAAEIGRELGVAYLLEGTIWRSRDRVRISAQLVEVPDQTPRWSHVYEAALVDVITAQKDVARAVADEMRIQLSASGLARLSRRATVDNEVYELYLKGRQAWSRRTAATLRQAIANFERALVKDPLYAPAYAGLADAYSLLSFYDDLPPHEAFPRAKAAALRALELDPGRAEAHTSLAYVAHRYEWNWTAAERSYRRALELNPSYATAHHWYAEFLIVRGRLAEARAELARAQKLDPLSPRIALDVSLPDYFEGGYDRALEQALRVTKLHPEFAPAWVAVRQYYERQGRYGEAIAALRETAMRLGLNSDEADSVEAAYRSSGPEGYWTRLLALTDREWPAPETSAHRANMYAALGDVSRALAWLERAWDERDDELVWMAVEPWYDPLRSEPRFQDLLRRMDLARDRQTLSRLQFLPPQGRGPMAFATRF